MQTIATIFENDSDHRCKYFGGGQSSGGDVEADAEAARHSVHVEPQRDANAVGHVKGRRPGPVDRPGSAQRRALGAERYHRHALQFVPAAHRPSGWFSFWLSRNLAANRFHNAPSGRQGKYQ